MKRNLPISPLIYPGSKRHLLKQILPHIEVDESRITTFIDVFVGGGSVSLAIAHQFPRLEIIMNDREPNIASFWRVVACGTEHEFAELTARMRMRPSIAMFKELRETEPTDLLDRGFRAMFFSRCTYGSLPEGNPRGGWEQSGEHKIYSRWNPNTITERMIAARKILYGRTAVLNSDFEHVIATADAEMLVFADPPYYWAGNQLYVGMWTDQDHVRLRTALMKAPNWFLTYDRHPRIIELYRTLAFELSAQYSLSKSQKMERMFFRHYTSTPDHNPDLGISDTLRIMIACPHGQPQHQCDLCCGRTVA
jgi:DNA adenine methylase